MVDEPTCVICSGQLDCVVENDASLLVTTVAGEAITGVQVVARAHVEEPFALSGTERRRFWEEAMRSARALRDATGASRVHYEIDATAGHVVLELMPVGAGRPLDLHGLREALVALEPRPRSQNPDVPAVYDEMATAFEAQAREGFYNAHYDRPAVLDACGEVAGLDVVELGCGPGFGIEALIARGARVVGIDGSRELLALARARVGTAVELIAHDLEQPLSMLATGRFDLVVMALVYHHIDDRAGLLGEVRRVLRPGGVLVLSSTHAVADWLISGGSYFTVERVDAPFVLRDGRRRLVPFWRLPMGVLVNEVLSAGFVLERLVEPIPPLDRFDLDPRLHRRLTAEPGFVVLRARAPSAPSPA